MVNYSLAVRKNFTLIELLIAFALSAFIMVGVYASLSSVINVKERLEASAYDMREFLTFERLLQRDIRMMNIEGASFPPLAAGEERLFTFVTANSLTFNKSIPVNVGYILKEETLYREERLASMNYVMRMPLLSSVTKYKAESFNGREYVKNWNVRAFLYRLTFTFKGKEREIIAAKSAEISL